MKAQVNKENVESFFQGKLRYKLFYSKFAFLIRKHIREQIIHRINSMDLKCYEDGECKICGCSTVALQMANKACDKPCYPNMVDKATWKHLKAGGAYLDTKQDILWIVENDKFYKKVKT